MRHVLFAIALSLGSPAFGADPGALDSWAGEWVVHDPSGKAIGESRIVVQAPNAMLYEERRIGDEEPQPLWFANSERDNAWIQMFVGPAGIRIFRQTTGPGAWPLMMSGEAVLRDGRPASFRLTVTRASADESRRLLEMSIDKGASWSPLFDYTYRRKK
jgi:hypothetical protein